MKTNNKRQGFTIVELLTVMGVIAILISLLVPALTLVRDYSKEIQQKAQFHAIEVGLEMYKAQFGSYPPSNDNQDIYEPTNDDLLDDHAYSGANKLAEAMVGLDMLGVHTNTGMRSTARNIRDDGTGTGTQEEYVVYHLTANDPGNAMGLFIESADENLKARKGPYLDLENANVFEMRDVYNVASGLAPFREVAAGSGDVGITNNIEQSLVLCDVFAVKRESGKKTGMPILYFRAKRQFTQQNSNVDSDGDGFDADDDIYYYVDNQNLLSLGTPEDPAIEHPLYQTTGGVGSADPINLDLFDNMIVNTQVTMIKRPYKADSYILIAAGKDGLYGTPDDITNFEKND